MRAPVQCVILIRPLGTTGPSSWLMIDGRPFLDYLLLEAWRFGFRRILFVAEGGASRLRASLDASRIGAETRLLIDVVEVPAAGAGAALRAVRSRLDEHFLLLDGHCWFDFNWLALVASAGATDRLATLAAPNAGRNRDRNFPGYAVALMSAKLAEHLSPASNLDDDLVQLAQTRAVASVSFSGRFIDIADPASRRLAGSVAQWRRRPAVFLDRDGTLNADTGYLHRIEDFRWLPGAVAAVRRLNDAGYYVFIVTNQSGVARGHYDEAAVLRLHAFMSDELRSFGAHIDDIRFCPHHPEAEVAAYRTACGCRKPAPGMLLDLMEQWPIWEERSVMIGDSERDAIAGRAAGIAADIIDNGGLAASVDRLLKDVRARGDEPVDQPSSS